MALYLCSCQRYNQFEEWMAWKNLLLMNKSLIIDPHPIIEFSQLFENLDCIR